MIEVCINRIATATPPYDVHSAFLAYASGLIEEDRKRTLLLHMAQRSAIDHRYSFIQVDPKNASGIC